MTNPADPATWPLISGRADPGQNERIQRARDAKVCACGHLNVSHGYGTPGGPAWPDGSRIGRGPCGIDSDHRTLATGYIGDRCQCVEFRERVSA